MGRMYSVYALRDPRTLAVHYVGMSSNTERRFKDHLRHTTDLVPWIEELRALGLQPELFILEQCEDEKVARASERAWIKQLGKSHPLANTQHNMEAIYKQIEEEARDEAIVRTLASFAPEDAKVLSPFFKAGWDRFGSTAWDYTFSIVSRTLALCQPHTTLQEVARLTWRVMDGEGDNE